MPTSNAKYSHKDFTGHDLSDRKDMDNIVIENSCFSNETPDALILPANLTGTTFIDCNLDNVFIPKGNTVVRGSVRRFQVQNDREDWLLDGQGKPSSPTNPGDFDKLGLSKDPVDLPADLLPTSITALKTQAIDQAKQDAIDQAVASLDVTKISPIAEPPINLKV